MVRRVKRKVEGWRQEPEEVRLRIATVLTAGAGLVGALVWLLILLPLQLHLTRPDGPDGVTTELKGVVSGIRDVATPSPNPTPPVQYFHGTRPSLQDNNSPLPSR